MALFVVRHEHPSERCPAKDPQMGAMLLDHLSEQNAQKYGMALHGEAVIDGQHTLYLILEAEDKEKVEAFMQPFGMAGSVEVMAASPCTAVIARRGCA